MKVLHLFASFACFSFPSKEKKEPIGGLHDEDQVCLVVLARLLVNRSISINLAVHTLAEIGGVSPVI